ncbi:anaphase-promoting complex subunit cdc27 [Ciborinia camelliae]|nr:anaphase-promoting complex subunit cdc27 [Ciborinia camelliae]
MPPSRKETINPCITTQLCQLIYYHIDNNLLNNALFFAERLHAYTPKGPESSYLLSLCHLRLGDYASAFEIVKGPGSKTGNLGCAYIYAQACLALGKLKEGIVALEKNRGCWGGQNSFGKHTEYSRHPYPDASAVCCLLGKLYRAFDDKKQSISYFEDALKLNPFMWDAFTNLCDMGTNVRVSSTFRMSVEMEAILKSNAQDREGPVEPFLVEEPRPSRPSARSYQSDPADPFNNSSSRSFAGGLFGSLTTSASSKLAESNPSLTNLPATSGGCISSDTMETPTGPSAPPDYAIAPSRKESGVVSAFPINMEPPQAPVRRNRTLQGLGMDFSMDVPKMGRSMASKRLQKAAAEISEDSSAGHNSRHNSVAAPGGDRKRTISGQVVPRQPSEDPGAPQRRSVRLINQFRPTSNKPSSNLATVGPAPGRELKKARPPISKIMRPAGVSTAGRQVSGNRKPVEDSMELEQREGDIRSRAAISTKSSGARSSESDSGTREEALRWLLDLFKKFGTGYSLLAKFQSQQALETFSTLSTQQQDTPWVLSQMGRAHYEQASYAEAETLYKRIRQIAPTRFEDMEIYSTVLWHLKRETDLAFLAHELVDSSWQSPEAWCALGNSWSLMRDHEQALRCFKRATQLKPKFAYAFTLQGHEHVMNEEYDKALTSYRHAMAVDRRHYNAYYGVGKVYEKMGNYDKAFIHFEAASKINPTNAVLLGLMGSVVDKKGNKALALAYFKKAIELDPKSALTRFKKARCLMTMGNMEDALEELKILKDLAPDEAMVHFLLGKLYKSIKQKGASVRHFTIALNLDPKASQHIKEAIESLEQGDDDEDDETSMMC